MITIKDQKSDKYYLKQLITLAKNLGYAVVIGNPKKRISADSSIFNTEKYGQLWKRFGQINYLSKEIFVSCFLTTECKIYTLAHEIGHAVNNPNWNTNQFSSMEREKTAWDCAFSTLKELGYFNLKRKKQFKQYKKDCLSSYLNNLDCQMEHDQLRNKNIYKLKKLLKLY